MPSIYVDIMVKRSMDSATLFVYPCNELRRMIFVRSLWESERP